MSNATENIKQSNSSSRAYGWIVFFFICLFLVTYSSVHNEEGNSQIYKTQKSLLKPDLVHTMSTTVRDHASKYELHGIDVARYQHNIQWNIMKLAGVDFAFMKSTEGVGLVDSFFAQNWKQAKENGIRRGAYHFFIAEKDPVIQAIHFIVNTPMDKYDMPPVLDVETTRGLAGWQIRGGMRKWLEVVEKATGKRPLIYTNFNFYEKYLAGYFENYPLWIADYRGGKAEYNKYSQWKFWQHTDQGDIDGIPTKVDVNVFNGSLSQLDSLCRSFTNHASDSLAFSNAISRKMKLILPNN